MDYNQKVDFPAPGVNDFSWLELLTHGDGDEIPIQEADSQQIVEPDGDLDEEDYIESQEESSEKDDINEYVVESDAPSVELEDLECSDDDDIFADKNLTKLQLVRVLREMTSKAIVPIPEPSKPVVVDEEEWYSDAHDDDELYSLSDSDGSARPKITHYTHYREGQNMKNFEFFKGMKFANAKQFREVLRDWSVRKGYELELIKNDGTRIRAKCVDEACTWVILASKPQGSNEFQVKTLEGEHKCVRKDRNRLAQKKYLVKRMLSTIRSTPNIKISDLQNKIREKVKVDVNKWMAIKVKKDATTMLRGAYVLQYAKLRDYGETLMAYNPGSSVYLIPVKDSNPPVFEKMYFCLDAMKKGFLAGCRPIIGLDGCFLKTPYGGQKKSDEVETAAEWLKKIPFKHWCRAYFSGNAKCDGLTNNISESFNNYILEARDKPIITMWEWIRVKLMERLQIKQEGMEKYTGTLCPNLVKKLNKVYERSTYCSVRASTDLCFEVHEYIDQYLVDLGKKTCSCGMYQLTGYPCCHAYACINYKRFDLNEYIDDVYKRDTYLKVYAFSINGVPGHRHYSSSGLASFEPPAVKKVKGRPTKERRKGPDELRSTSTRVGLTHTCQKCFGTGHNIASCRKEPHPKSKYYKSATSAPPSRTTVEKHSSTSSTAHVPPKKTASISKVKEPAPLKRKKKLTEYEVLNNTRERSKKRRGGQS